MTRDKARPPAPAPDDPMPRRLRKALCLWWWESDATFVSRRALAGLAIAFVATWAFMSLGFLIVQGAAKVAATAADKADSEASRRSYMNCVRSNEDNAELRDFIADLDRGFPGVPILEQALRDAATKFPDRRCPPNPDSTP